VVRFCAALGKDVDDLPAADEQGIGDEGAVAAPGDGFSTHDGGGFL